MKNILVLGAGRSAAALIDYLIKACNTEGWKLRIGDYDIKNISEQEGIEIIQFDINNVDQKNELIGQADLVVSMLPAQFHPIVAHACLEHEAHLVTASYVSEELKNLNDEAKKKELIFINECGLDPGIDHMSAMKVIDTIRENGHELKSFETFTGGLLAPSEEDNPWEYKFTWNPRNVVLAGQGVVKFIQEGRYKYIPYHKIFKRTEIVHIPGHGYFEGYANRDSLKYLDVYDLRGIQTLYRGTFRRPGYCKAWDVFVHIGATDDSYQMEGVENMTHRQFINSFLSYNPHDSVELKLAHYMNLEIDGPEMHKMRWLGIFDDEPVGLSKGTPAQILERILKKKWTLNQDDRDMIVMWHKFDYVANGEPKQIQSTLVAIGDDSTNTAMSKTVGIPVGIAAKLILKGIITEPGVHIPTSKSIYAPILNELEELGFEMSEKETITND